MYTPGPQLLQLGRPKAAAQVFLSGGGEQMVKEAIDALMAARDWSRAKRVATELEPRLEEYVDTAYKEHLKEEGETEVGAGGGGRGESHSVFRTLALVRTCLGP